MHNAIKILLTVAVFVSSSLSSAQISPFVVGGGNATIEQAPWQAFVWANNHFCGGVVVANEWVLTAAHCLDNSNSNEPFSAVPISLISVYTGTAQILDSQFYTHRSSVASIYPFEYYDKTTFANDIALIKLAQPIHSPAQPIAIATENDQIALDATANLGLQDLTVSGWGFIDSDRNVTTTVLQQAQLSLVNDTTCAAVWGSTLLNVSFFQDKYICAQSLGKGSCNGDSGGPLVWHDPSLAADPDQGARLVGLVSFGIDTQCASERYPDVYTQVSNYAGWINDCIDGSCTSPIAGEFIDQNSGGKGNTGFLFIGLILFALFYRSLTLASSLRR